MSEYAALASRIRINLRDLDATVNRALELGNKANRSGDDGYWDGVALNLHGFYTGVEHIFEDIARTIEGNNPSGANWHVDLLLQMTNEIDGIRPSVISESTRKVLTDLLNFAQFLETIYIYLTTKLFDC